MNGFRTPNSIGELAIWVVIVSAVVALMYIALREFGIAIPGWVVHAFWVVLVAVVIIFAIKLVMGIGSKDGP
jgi:hypothetical protein